jgi:uncharacterized protein
LRWHREITNLPHHHQVLLNLTKTTLEKYMNRETRQIIFNQLEILKKVDPSGAKDYEIQQRIIDGGYTSRYGEVLTVREHEVGDQVQREVYDFFDMFRALDNALALGWTPDDVSDAKFQGLDGNNDDEYYSFAQHLLDVEGLFGESAPMKNSHSSGTIDRYRRMVNEWKKAPAPYRLTHAEADAIIAA